jgi:ferredoxin
VVEDGKLVGMTFDEVEYPNDDGRERASTIRQVMIECDDVILAIGQENSFPWIERDIGIEFDEWEVPTVDKVTFQSTREGVFFGGDAAFGPENIIWAVAHGHQAAISIHKYCLGESLTERLPDAVDVHTSKMGLHEWAFSNAYDPNPRKVVPQVPMENRFKGLDIEVELGFGEEEWRVEVERCLNCDVQTIFFNEKCIECDACIDVCPTQCLTMTQDADEDELRTKLKAPAENPSQALYVSGTLKQTGRVMVKDEDQCVHCGLCAERCPTAAWDMKRAKISIPKVHHEEAARQDRKETA